MINIPYKHGEMNIDIVKFLVNRNLNDIRYLCKNIIAISPKRLDINNEICYTIEAIRNGGIERPKFYNPKDTVHQDTNEDLWAFLWLSNALVELDKWYEEIEV